MVTRTSPWPPGTPCWADCAFAPAHRGLHHARDFYEKLFGWDINPAPHAGEDYLLCDKDELPVAGLQREYEQDAPPFWTTYFATDDLDATAALVTSAGGRVLTEPTDVSGLGRAAYCADPTGAFFGLWQGGTLPGAGLVGEPGSVCANTLLTRDLRAAQDFYARVFGYSFRADGDDAAAAFLPGGERACTLHRADQLPADQPPSWLLHFAVADRDSSAQIAQELGASILMTMDSPLGPDAILQGKHGEVFGIVALSGSGG